MEAVGVAFALPAIAQLLVETAIEGCRIFQAAKVAGEEIQLADWQLDVCRQRLEDWVENLESRGGLIELAGGKSKKRYRLILQTLIIIAGVFAEVEQLESKYGVKRDIEVAPASKKSKFKNLLSRSWRRSNHSNDSDRDSKDDDNRRLSSSSSRSLVFDEQRPKSSSGKSPIPVVKAVSPRSSSFQLEINDKEVQQYPDEGDLEYDMPGVEEFATGLRTKAEQYQEALSAYKKYEWVIYRRDKAQALISDIEKYIDTLEKLTSAKLITTSYPLKTSVSFDEFRVEDRPPFPRLKTFFGRQDILDNLGNIFQKSISEKNGFYNREIVVLLGMGGMGKSQVAVEYAYANATEYNSVYWVDTTDDGTLATSSRRILESLISHYSKKYPSDVDFPRIATDLGIPGQINREGKLTGGEAVETPWKVVQNWLSKDGNSRWLLVMDGISDDNRAEWLEQVFPAGSHGHIIITSRVAVRSCDHEHTIDIPTMDADSSLRMLVGSKLDELAQDLRETACAIADKLGHLPLALSQAVSYMNSKKLSLIEYFKRLSEDIARIVGLRFPPYAEGVFSCWKLSIQALQKANPDSIILLRFCSFLSPEGISIELLQRGLGAIGWLDDDQYRLDDAIDELVSYSLVNRKSPAEKQLVQEHRSNSLWVHPLVQLWARNSYNEESAVFLERNSQRLEQLHKERAIEAIVLVGSSIKSDFGSRQSTEWIFERDNMAHILMCVEQYFPKYIVGNNDLKNENLAIALRRLGKMKVYWNQSQPAIDMLRESIRVYTQLSGVGSEAEMGLLMAKQDLAMTYINRGSALDCPLSEVTRLIGEVSKKQEQVLGQFNPETLHSMALRAFWMSKGQRHHARALRALTKCVDNNEKHLTSNNNIYITAIFYLGSVHSRLENYDKAVEMFERALALEIQHNGQYHQNALLVLRELASTINRNKSGDKEIACRYLERAVETSEGLYGLASPLTLQIMMQLRKSYIRTNQLQKAQMTLQRNRQGWEALKAIPPRTRSELESSEKS